ncbi:MCE family protein [Nocardioides sp. DS6]|uniref:MCE family protein n=1 Tax=Nocardioides eburneus TaxID=3231482 RepID=A0ABV3SWJ6_9ACTN
MKRLVSLVVVLLVGSLTLGGCGFSVYSLPLPGGADTGKDPLTVKVQFADVLDLVPQSTVKVDDVTVGKVTKVQLDHGVAVVTLQLRKDTKLPSNARAEIQQTSLLGEKYVALSAPSDPSPTPLKDHATITLAHTGQNPEIEEVLGALSLILNGGGVAQLKTISTELNKALGGREDSARSVLNEVNQLATSLDDNKQEIVHAIESVNKLSKSIHGQEKTIDKTLDELPAALTSINSQRKDLVTMLKALDKLGDTGVRVINASKTNTIQIVRDLQPVLTELTNAGDHFVNSFNTLLTYPFVDAAVGTNPQVARNLHMGDYVNLDITLDLGLDSLKQLPGAGSAVCTVSSALTSQIKNAKTPKQLQQLLDKLSGTLGSAACGEVKKQVDACQQAIESALTGGNPSATACQDVLPSLTKTLQSSLNDLLGGVLGGGSGGSSSGGSDGGLVGGLLGGLLGGAGRAPTDYRPQRVSVAQLDAAYDPTLVQLLVPGIDAGDATEGGSR